MNTEKEAIVLIGGGGHCKSVIDVIETEGKFYVAGIVDSPEKKGQPILNHEILWTDDELDDLATKYKCFAITIGQIKSSSPRVKIYDMLKTLNIKMPVLKSPHAYFSKYSYAGEATVVMNRAIVNANVKIGVSCIINTAAIIEHDVSIGDHCHISTGAVVNGDVKIGNSVFIGSNAVVNQEIRIADNVVVGSGSIINKDIIESGIYAGNPLKKINEKVN